MKIVLAAVLLSLAGCASNPCQKYPAACAVAGAIVVGSVAACIEMNRGNGHSSAVPMVKHPIVEVSQ